MKKICYLCERKLADKDAYQFFPEDDTYICLDCLEKMKAKDKKKKTAQK
jgi:hypothetical protein